MEKNVIKAKDKLKSLLLKYAKYYYGMPIALSGGIDSSLLAALIKPRFAITTIVPGDDVRFNELKYAKMVADHLDIPHIVVKVDDSDWDGYMEEAVKAIGRPIPHFNIFPLFTMYKKLYELGEKKLVLGDGADETMCGYARDLIIKYLYKIYDFEAFENYRPLIDKILPPMGVAIERATGKKPLDGETIIDVNMRAMRPDMDDMANGIAKNFGIINHRPYQDNKELDNFMYNLADELKINNVEYGKYLLRLVAEDYLPSEIAWRKVKVGGIVYPVNTKRGWLDKGEFNKEKYLQYQQQILEGV